MAKKKRVVKSPVISAIKQTFTSIPKNKLIILFIIITQIIFLGAFLFTQYKLQIPILTEGQDIIMSIQENMQTQANPEGDFNIMKDSLTTIVGLQTQVKKMIKGIIYLIISTFLLWIIINGMNWFLTSRLYSETRLYKYCIRFITISLIYFIPMVLAVWWYMSSSIKTALFGTSKTGPTIGAVLIIAVFSYFFYISLCLIHKKTFKEIFKATFKLGYHKFWKMILIYLIPIILYTALFIVASHSLEAHIYILYLEIILFIAIIILSRIFLSFAINNLEKEIK